MIYSKPTANIKLNGETLKTIPLKSGTRQGCLLSPYLFNIALNVLAKAIREQKEIKEIPLGKEEVKISLQADDMIIYISNPQILPENSYSCKAVGYKIYSKESIGLIYSKDKRAEKGIRETSPFIIAANSIKYFGITLTKEVADLFDKKFKSLKKEIKEHIRRWKDLSMLLNR